MSESRPDWDTYFIEFSHLASKRSTCLRRKVGAVIVKDRNILATGYNGAPKGLPHCAETGCERQRQNVPSGQRHELCRGLHAEQNAIIQAAYHGTSIKGATLYCNTFPCVICAKMIINAGIQRIVYEAQYADELSAQMLQQSGIELLRYQPSAVAQKEDA
ncbi:MAG: cytidine/deoxycytidylate deaminase family protein [Candidatus Alcyoniella australis]|nr:cytidine/deoxycytidylate deaminase family protein [Candidatus Alcyoniella australis]